MIAVIVIFVVLALVVIGIIIIEGIKEIIKKNK